MEVQTRLQQMKLPLMSKDKQMRLRQGGELEGRSTSSAESDADDSSEHSRINPGKNVNSHVPGMEAVVVTVSGYDSLSRTKLVKLIVHIGASNTGSLSNCNTHVVCWKFEGRKYELAKKLRKKFVSHRWFEDCLKAGVLLPEEPYLNKSGEEEAPLSWDDSVVKSPHSKVERKTCFTINLAQSVSQPELSSGKDTSTWRREPDLVAFDGRSLYSDDTDTGWSLHTSSKGATSPKRSLSVAGVDHAVPSAVAHLPQAQKHEKCSLKALGSSDSASQQTYEHHESQVPAETRTEKAMGVSASTSVSFTDQSNELRHQSGREAYSSRSCPTEIGEQTGQSGSPYIVNYGSARREDYNANYAEIRLRKRKEVEAPSGGLSEKYRRLMNESPALTSCKLALEDERAGSPGRAFSSRYLGSPSSPHAARRTRSAGFEVDNQLNGYIRQANNADLLVNTVAEYASPSKDIACVICHTETKPTTEGLLECGHRYCYPCIQKWADEATSKQSTCPLCKASFEFITIRELERSANEEICTQVLEERVVLVGKQIRQGQRINLPCPRTEGFCITCESKDSPEFLMTCGRCRQRCCHTFCLDPPLPPGSSWFCSRCAPMRSR